MSLSALSAYFLLNPFLFAFSQAPDDAKRKAAKEDDIREAVLRDLMMDWARRGDKSEAEAKDEVEKRIAKGLNFKIFFVSVDTKDPTDEFLKRFQDIPRIVKRGSAAEIAETTMRMPVVDKETQTRGIIFRADKIVWKGKGHVTVDGGYHCDGLCGAGYTFDVRFEKENWVVKKERLNWIS